MSDSGLSDIGLNCFTIGLIRYRTEGLQSDKFLSDIGQAISMSDIGYRRQKYLMSRAPTYGAIVTRIVGAAEVTRALKPVLNQSQVHTVSGAE
jgi:hypothetical protein